MGLGEDIAEGFGFKEDNIESFLLEDVVYQLKRIADSLEEYNKRMFIGSTQKEVRK